MAGASTIRLLGIDPARGINPHLSAQAILEQTELPRDDLEVLGWKVEVEPRGENILITVDFGNWRVE